MSADKILLYLAMPAIVLTTITFLVVVWLPYFRNIRSAVERTHEKADIIVGTNELLLQDIHYLKTSVSQTLIPSVTNLNQVLKDQRRITSATFGSLLDRLGLKFTIITPDNAAFALKLTHEGTSVLVLFLFNDEITVTIQSIAYQVPKPALSNVDFLKRLVSFGSSLTLGGVSLREFDDFGAIVVSVGLPIDSTHYEDQVILGLIQSIVMLQKTLVPVLANNVAQLTPLEGQNFIEAHNKQISAVRAALTTAVKKSDINSAS